jgi:hypothetical protein
MDRGFLKSKPQWFWELTGDEAEVASIPDWLTEWWTIYDGSYYSAKDVGIVVKNDDVHGFTVTWGMLKGETKPTIEDFTPLSWSSQTEMNATSDKYWPIYARKV